jgi:hypothetical protein
LSTRYNFQNRFSYPNDNGISSGIDFEVAQSFSDADIEGVNPEVSKFAQLVRQYSVLLGARTTLEIFNIVTQQVDPRIALILASAKRREDNNPLFAGLGQVSEVMFSDPNRPAGIGSQNRPYLSDGIRRIAAALTAAILIGQLAQISEQFEHAKDIEKRALEDLDRVCSTWEINSNTSTTANSESTKEEEVSFYFEKLTFTIPADKKLAVYWYSPSFALTWVSVQTYTGSLDSWMVVSDLADSINSSIPADSDLSLVAVAQLSGPAVLPEPLHTLSFYPRHAQPGVVAHSVNIRIELQPLTGTAIRNVDTLSSFRWGPYYNSISLLPVNGQIIVTDYNRLTANALQRIESIEPIVLYIRNSVNYIEGGGTPPETSDIVLRSQPWQPNLSAADNKPSENLIPFSRQTAANLQEQLDLDNYRFSQVALAILNNLAENNLLTRATGAIIRNDPLDIAQPMAGIELIAWGITQSNAYVLLDVLKVPSDIEIAIGDRTGPKSLFSPHSRTLRVKCIHVKASNTLSQQYSEKDKPYRIARKSSSIWRDIKEEAAAIESRWYSS